MSRTVEIHFRTDRITDFQLEVLRAVLAPHYGDGTVLEVNRVAGQIYSVQRTFPEPLLLGGKIGVKWPRSIYWRPAQGPIGPIIKDLFHDDLRRNCTDIMGRRPGAQD